MQIEDSRKKYKRIHPYVRAHVLWTWTLKGINDDIDDILPWRILVKSMICTLEHWNLSHHDSWMKSDMIMTNVLLWKRNTYCWLLRGDRKLVVDSRRVFGSLRRSQPKLKRFEYRHVHPNPAKAKSRLCTHIFTILYYRVHHHKLCFLISFMYFYISTYNRFL